MVALDTLAIHEPPDLVGQPNGRLPSSLLRECKGGFALHHWAADAYDAMYDAAEADGIHLQLSGGYRTYDAQVALFLDRYSPSYNPFKTTLSWKMWNGKRYWKRYGVATAAVPGTSNHGLGLAGDEISTGLGSQAAPGPKLRWLATHARSFGFTWELLPEEPWHVVYFLGFALIHGGPQPLPPPPPAPNPPPIPSPPVTGEQEADMHVFTPTKRGDGRTLDFTFLPGKGEGFGVLIASRVMMRRNQTYPVASLPHVILYQGDGAHVWEGDLPANGTTVVHDVEREGFCSVECTNLPDDAVVCEAQTVYFWTGR